MDNTAILLAAREAASIVAQIFSECCASNVTSSDSQNPYATTINASVEDYLRKVQDYARKTPLDGIVDYRSLRWSSTVVSEAGHLQNYKLYKEIDRTFGPQMLRWTLSSRRGQPMLPIGGFCAEEVV